MQQFVFSLEINKHALPIISMTKLREVKFSIQFCHRFVNVAQVSLCKSTRYNLENMENHPNSTPHTLSMWVMMSTDDSEPAMAMAL